jgi:hypothetical protein
MLTKNYESVANNEQGLGNMFKTKNYAQKKEPTV